MRTTHPFPNQFHALFEKFVESNPYPDNFVQKCQNVRFVLKTKTGILDKTKQNLDLLHSLRNEALFLFCHDLVDSHVKFILLLVLLGIKPIDKTMGGLHRTDCHAM